MGTQRPQLVRHRIFLVACPAPSLRNKSVCYLASLISLLLLLHLFFTLIPLPLQTYKHQRIFSIKKNHSVPLTKLLMQEMPMIVEPEVFQDFIGKIHLYSLVFVHNFC